MALCERCRAELPNEPLPDEHFDVDTRVVIVDGERRYITPCQWQLLKILWRRRGLIVSTDSMMSALYSDALEPPGDHVIAAQLSYLRKKLKGTPFVISVAYGLGYRLDSL